MTDEGSKGEEDVEEIEHGDFADSPVGPMEPSTAQNKATTLLKLTIRMKLPCAMIPIATPPPSSTKTSFVVIHWDVTPQ